MQPSLSGLRVCWFKPDKPEHLSVEQRRLGTHLEEMGASVTLLGTTPGTVRQAFGERHSYDVFMGTTRAGAIAGALLARLSGRPFVADHVDPIRQFATTHPTWLARLVERLENLSFRLSSHTLFVYDEEEARVRSTAPRATQTDLGIDVDRFRSPVEQPDAGTEALRDAGVTGNVVIYIGGLEPLYNIEALLDSVHHLDDDWTLVVAGAGSMEPQVRAAARGDRVAYLGLVDHDEIPGLLQAADVGVSLVDDPHTLKVLEYGVARLPVVQLAGRAEDRFGDRVEYCTSDPGTIASAIERAKDRDGTALQSYASQFDLREIAETYARVLLSASQG